VSVTPAAYVGDLVSLGRFVQGQRRQLGLTQTQLGVRLDWHQERVSLLEAGKSGTPSLKALANLACALIVARSDLLVAVRFLANPMSGEIAAVRPIVGQSATDSSDLA